MGLPGTIASVEMRRSAVAARGKISTAASSALAAGECVPSTAKCGCQKSEYSGRYFVAAESVTAAPEAEPEPEQEEAGE